MWNFIHREVSKKTTYTFLQKAVQNEQPFLFRNPVRELNLLMGLLIEHKPCKKTGMIHENLARNITEL